MWPRLAVQAAIEFMHVKKQPDRMSAYRCKYCGDWHISSQIRGENNADYLVIDRDPSFMSHNTISRNRRMRKSRVAIEKYRQERQRFLGD